MNQTPDNNQEPNQNKGKMKFPKMKKQHTITFWIVMLLFMVFIYQMYTVNKGKIKEISYTEMMNKANNNDLTRVIFNEKDVIMFDQKRQRFHTYLPFRDPDLVKKLVAKNILVSSRKPSQLVGIIVSWLPFLIFIGFWLFMMRSMQGGGSKAFSFGKSKAKLFASGKTNITFKDVAGVEEAKEELEEIVEFLEDPKKFQKLGGRIPRGVLLLGRPGTGKTLLAKAVAGEAKVPFFSMSGSDFVEMFVGVGASRVRDLFEQAKKNAPCIAFIDEIDAVGRYRGSGVGGGNDEREQTLNQLLVEMDGFEQNDSVIIIAATNRPDVLDPALLRPGRFDRQVTVDLPDIRGREAILKVHSRKLPVAKSVRLSLIARSTPGFSGADLANLCNEAALLAARKNKTNIFMEDFEEAKDKVTMGKAKRSRVISDEDKLITAYHEIGHVLCSIFQTKTEPVHKVTIIPRGFSAGATHYLQSDKSNYSRGYLTQKLVELLGGRSAEEVKFNEMTTGASNDIDRATDIARKMVCNWGMSDEFGPISVHKEQDNVFLGKQLGEHDNYSNETAQLVDIEIKKFIVEAHNKAKEIISNHFDLMNKLAEKLLEEETLDTDDLFELIIKNVNEDEKGIVEKKHNEALQFSINLLPTDEIEEKEDLAENESEKESENEESSANNIDEKKEEEV